MSGLPASPAEAAPQPLSFGQALAFWLKLGFVSFGGPAGQIALMHAELVERRRWISEKRFLHALNYCMVLPGPEAQQLATYIGWLLHRTWGGIAAGGLFVLPSFFILIGLSWVYLAYGEVPAVAGLFYGIKPAVTAIVVAAAIRIGSRVLKNAWLWGVAVAAFTAIFAVGIPQPQPQRHRVEEALQQPLPRLLLVTLEQFGGVGPTFASTQWVCRIASSTPRRAASS